MRDRGASKKPSLGPSDVGRGMSAGWNEWVQRRDLGWPDIFTDRSSSRLFIQAFEAWFTLKPLGRASLSMREKEARKGGKNSPNAQLLRSPMSPLVVLGSFCSLEGTERRAQVNWTRWIAMRWDATLVLWLSCILYSSRLRCHIFR